MKLLFTEAEHRVFEAILAELRKGVLIAPLRIMLLCICLPILIGVVVIDFEFFYRVFEYLAGEAGFWSPTLMAFTGTLMMLAFHLLAAYRAGDRVVRLITRLAGWAVLAFVIGGGAFIAAMLYADGMGDLIAPETPIMLGAIHDPPQGSWLDALFTRVHGPLATLIISLGIGGVTVVAVFAAHVLIGILRKQLVAVYTALRTYREAKERHLAIRQGETRLTELELRQAELESRTIDDFREQVAGEALEVVAQQLLPHEQTLQNALFHIPGHRWDELDQDETARISEAVERIRAITPGDVIRAITPKAPAKPRHSKSPKQARK